MTDPATRLIEAALPHVAFEGWSEATLLAAAADCGIDAALAKALFPRGGVDMALAFHRLGDETLRTALQAHDLSGLKMREKVALAVRLRLENADREAVRRGSTLLALPLYAPEGARAMWQSADLIWTALGDSSNDLNWYSKRAILASVLGATVLYWLGDESEASAATWEFLDRRIEGVMRFETAKARMLENPLLKGLMGLPEALAGIGRPQPTENSGA